MGLLDSYSRNNLNRKFTYILFTDDGRREIMSKKILIELDDYILEHIAAKDVNFEMVDEICRAIENRIEEDDYSEIIRRPINVKWSYSPGTTDLTCPICREVSKRSIFNNFCPNCGAAMRGDNHG